MKGRRERLTAGGRILETDESTLPGQALSKLAPARFLPFPRALDTQIKASLMVVKSLEKF